MDGKTFANEQERVWKVMLIFLRKALGVKKNKVVEETNK